MGSAWLADQDAVRTLCSEAAAPIAWLDSLGLPFSRQADGRLSQRPFGGQRRNRTCYIADHTGHNLLHTLYEQCIKHDVRFYSEFFVIRLLMENNGCSGVVAWDMRNGGLEVFPAKTVMFGTGGYTRAWKVNTNAL